MEFEVKEIKNEKFTITYTKIGHGPKNFIMIPGMSLKPVNLSAAAIANSFRMFNDEYTIYCFDHKINADENYSIEDKANDVVECCKILGLKNLYLYGASLGGFVVLNIAIKYPELVKKVVVVSSSYYLNESSKAFMDKVIDLVNQRDVRSLLSYSLRMIYSEEFNNKFKDFFIKSNQDLSEYYMDQYKYEAISLKRARYLLNDLPRIKAKTLIIVSKKDKIFGYEPSLLMSIKIPNCECILYDDYSHAVYDEAPDLRDRLKKFFDN